MKSLASKPGQEQRERQNSTRFMSIMCFTLFCTFLCRYCPTTTWKCLISRFMEDVNKLRQNFLSLSKIWVRPPGNQLQANLPTSYIFSEFERTLIHFKSYVFAVVAVVDAKTLGARSRGNIWQFQRLSTSQRKFIPNNFASVNENLKAKGGIGELA